MNGTECKDFDKYEDYLDSIVTQNDLFYLGSVDLARRHVEYGHTSTSVIGREEFAQQKRIAAELLLASKEKKARQLASAGCCFTAQQPLLQALADREEAVCDGRLQTVIFIRDTIAGRQEVSGYIDFRHRLLKGDMEAVFSGRKRLLPCATDLSYYNWVTQTLETCPSEDFQAVSDVHAGFLELENKRDGTAIRVDPSCAPGLCSTRIEVETGEYQQVLLFDHYPAS